MKIKLVILFALLGLSTAFATVSDFDWVLQARFGIFRDPIKMAMIDSAAGLSTHVVVYKAWGAYYFEEVSANVVIMEAIWCSPRSDEKPDSVVKRVKSVLGEGYNWEPTQTEFTRRDSAWTALKRADGGFAICFRSGENNDRAIIYSFFNHASVDDIQAGLDKIGELMNDLKNEDEIP